MANTGFRSLTPSLLALALIVGCGQPAERDLDPPPRPADVPAVADDDPRSSGDSSAANGGRSSVSDRGSAATKENPSLDEFLDELTREEAEANRALDELLGSAGSGSGNSTGGNRKALPPIPKPPASDSPHATPKDPAFPKEKYESHETGEALVKRLPADGSEGLRRVHDDQWRASLFGEPATVAEARYGQGTSGRVRVQIADLGRESEVLARRALLWQRQATRDPILEMQFAKARFIDDRPAFIRYDAERSTGSIETVLQGRYHIHVGGETVHLDLLERIVRSLFAAENSSSD